MSHPLKKIINLQKQGKAVGIYSVCSANKYVLDACIEKAVSTNSPILIESTANQVDQYGGYTGMKPKDFYDFVKKIAKEKGLPDSDLILGGDHLGPLTFTSLNEDEAMSEASELIRQYVLAGFTKIHIDTSMKVSSDDKDIRLSDEIISKRGAVLASVAEESYNELLKTNKDAIHPVYIIGSEVPIPGGSQDAVDEGVQITKVSDFKATYKAFEEAFKNKGLSLENVIGVVVQPGVEEKDAGCTEYDREKASDLMKSIKDFDNIVFEGHSTDYQTKIKLKELVEDGVGILKVGPGLTFAMREALFALANIENEYFKDTDVKVSNFIEILDEEMLKDPKYWNKHYHGNNQEIALKRKYSFSDRSRYYMPKENVEKAIDIMINNLDTYGIPLNLLSQFMPIQYTLVREGKLTLNCNELIKSRIKNTCDEYLYATNQDKLK